jgi:hypothetical protein
MAEQQQQDQQAAAAQDDPSTFRLTQLSHGGGCGCKIAPAKLQQVWGACVLAG